MLGIVGGVVLAEAVIPFNRVWSFPKEIVIAPPYLYSVAVITDTALEKVERMPRFKVKHYADGSVYLAPLPDSGFFDFMPAGRYEVSRSQSENEAAFLGTGQLIY